MDQEGVVEATHCSIYISDIQFVSLGSKKRCGEEGDPDVQLTEPHKDVTPPSAAAVTRFLEEINTAK